MLAPPLCITLAALDEAALDGLSELSRDRRVNGLVPAPLFLVPALKQEGRRAPVQLRVFLDAFDQMPLPGTRAYMPRKTRDTATRLVAPAPAIDETSPRRSHWPCRPDVVALAN